jgi:glycolate oxidase iron-sulfur subunit
LALLGARIAQPFRNLMPRRLKAMLDLMPAHLPSPSRVSLPQTFVAQGARKKRVALLSVCAQQVLAPRIDEATVRLLTRLGCEVVIAEGAGCCGSLTHHMGRDSRAMMKANIDAWLRVVDAGGLDAIVINVSGCGTTIKEYAYTFRDDPVYADKAARISALAQDVSEFAATLEFEATQAPGLRVAYHAACSLQHGQRVLAAPKILLAKAGFTVVDPPEAHICCGSAGTYNMLQPEIAASLRARKVRNIESTAPQVIAAGNIGCIEQIGAGTGIPVVHTVELLDWATGGPVPEALSAFSETVAAE